MCVCVCVCKSARVCLFVGGCVLSSCCQSDTDFILFFCRVSILVLSWGSSFLFFYFVHHFSFHFFVVAVFLSSWGNGCNDDDVLVEVVSFSCCGFCHCVFLVLWKWCSFPSCSVWGFWAGYFFFVVFFQSLGYWCNFGKDLLQVVKFWLCVCVCVFLGPVSWFVVVFSRYLVSWVVCYGGSDSGWRLIVFCKQSTYQTEWSLKLIIPEGIIIKAADTNCVIGRSNMSLFGMGRSEFCTNASVLHCKFHMQNTWDLKTNFLHQFLLHKHLSFVNN